MHRIQRLAPALILLVVFISATPFSAQADSSAGIEAAGHLIEGENALQAGDYLKAATEYRKAAQLSQNVEVAQKATQIGMSLGFNKEALLSVERWMELEPESDDARVLYAQLQLRLGNIKESRRTIEDLLDTGDGKDDHRLLSLLPILSEEDPRSADLLMRSLAKPYPDSAPANYATAVMALQAGESEYALEKANRALELEPKWLKPKLVVGRALLMEGNVDEAIEYIAQIIGDDPNVDPDARMELALMYISADRPDDAMSQINQILLEQPSRSDALRLMAILNFRQNNLDAATEDFEDLLASGRFTTDALYYLARIADLRNEHERAAKLYMQVNEGQYAVTSQRRASALTAIQLELPGEALRNLDIFGERFPEYAVDMVLAKAQLLAALERYDEALELYEQAREFRPEDEGTALGRASLLLSMDQLREAINAYRSAVRRWPDSATSLNALGYTLADRTDSYDEAERLIRKALRFEPNNPAIIDSLGWVLYKRGKYEEALEQLRIAFSQFPDSEVAAHIVDVLAAMDRNEEALEVLVSAEERDPESELLRAARERHFAESE
jgi:tetratricopeptide (TPR) repeat protein